MMAEFCNDFSGRRDDRTFQPIPVTDDEARAVTEGALRYSILRWIAEIQNPPTLFSYRQGVGASSNTDPAVAVPDATAYPKDKLEELLKASKFGKRKTQYLGFWLIQDELIFEVPEGSNVHFTPSAITFSKKGVYKLQFTVEYVGKNIGAPGLPAGFKPLENPSDLVGLMFTVKERLEWYGEYSDADPYIDWASGLFAGLEKRLKQPSLFDPESH
jgi:hypothetical protein